MRIVLETSALRCVQADPVVYDAELWLKRRERIYY